MRILFVHNRYLQSAGGEDTTVEAEVKLLTERGHVVETVIFTNDGFGGGVVDKLKAGVLALYNGASKERLKEAIGSFRPDVIHVHNFYFQASPSIFDAAYECQVPIVFTLHNYRLVCVNALLLRDNKVCEDCIHSIFAWKGIVRKCYHHSVKDSAVVALIATTHRLKKTWTTKVDQFITPSSFMREKLLGSSLGVKDPEKIVVKHNFIDDPGMADPAAREDYYLFVGRLSEEKGVDFLLQSMAHVPAEKLLVVGDGPQGDYLRTRYSGYSNIVFLGKQDRSEVLRLLKRSRGLLFPSIWYEGLPITIIEALATGTPIIASDLGAMPAMVKPAVSGYLFEKEDRAALLAAMEDLNNRVAGQDHSLHEGARQAYLQDYHPDVCYAKTMEIYSSVINERVNRTI